MVQDFVRTIMAIQGVFLLFGLICVGRAVIELSVGAKQIAQKSLTWSLVGWVGLLVTPSAWGVLNYFFGSL